MLKKIFSITFILLSFCINNLFALAPSFEKKSLEELKQQAIITMVKNPKSINYQNYLLQLPEEILIRILSFLSIEDIYHLSTLHSFLKKICSDNILWKNLWDKYLKKDFPYLSFPTDEELPIVWKNVVKNLYQKSLYLTEPQLLEQHNNSAIFLTQLTPNIVVSGSTDYTLKLWDIYTQECITTLEGHQHWVNLAVPLPSNKMISTSMDGTIKIWDLTNLYNIQCLHTIKAHKAPILSIIPLPLNQVLTASADSTIKLWDINTGQCLKIFNGHQGVVNQLIVLNKKYFLSSSTDKTIKLWNIKTEQCERTFQEHTDSISTIILFNKKILISASADQTIKIWDLAAAKCLATLEGHKSYVLFLKQLDANTFASASSDGEIKIWDLTDINNAKCLWTVQAHINQITSLVPLAHGTMLLSASKDGTIKLFDLSLRKCVQILNHQSPINSAIQLVEGQLLSAADNGTLALWDIDILAQYSSSLKKSS